MSEDEMRQLGLERVPTDDDGNPTGPYDHALEVADLGRLPKTFRIPAVRFITMLDPLGDSRRRSSHSVQ